MTLLKRLREVTSFSRSSEPPSWVALPHIHRTCPSLSERPFPGSHPTPSSLTTYCLTLPELWTCFGICTKFIDSWLFAMVPPVKVVQFFRCLYSIGDIIHLPSRFHYPRIKSSTGHQAIVYGSLHAFHRKCPLRPSSTTVH